MAKGKKLIYEEVVWPTAMLKLCFLNEPSQQFDGKGDPMYKVRVLLEDTEENRAKIEGALDRAREAAKKNGVKLKKVHKLPFLMPEDVDEDDFIPAEGKDRPKYDEDYQGKIIFETKSKFPPMMIDAQRKALPEDVKIYSGDQGRVKTEVMPYEGLGSGISLRLKAVQLIAKNTSFSGGYNNTDGFDDVEGGYVAGGSSDDDDENF